MGDLNVKRGANNRYETVVDEMLTGYDGLLNAIAYDAMKDYVKLNKIAFNTKCEMDRTRRFFLEDCETVTGLDGELLLEKMDKYLKEEGYII